MRARLHVRGGQLGFFREGTHDVCDPRPSRQLLPETCDALERLMASARSLGDLVREVELSENIAATERVVHVETSGPVGSSRTRRVDAGGGCDTRSLRDRRSSSPPPARALVLSGQSVSDSRSRGPRGAAAPGRWPRPGSVRRRGPLFRHGLDDGRRESHGGRRGSVRGRGSRAQRARRLGKQEREASAERAGVPGGSSESGGFVEAVRSDVESFVATRARDVRGSDEAFTAVDCRSAAHGSVAGGARWHSRIEDSEDGLRLVRRSHARARFASVCRRGLSLTRVDAFDMFPNTPHVETVVTFEIR